MRPKDLIREGTLGGPGLDGYAYNADVYCVGCGETIYREIADEVAPKLTGVEDPLFSDSETVPQPIFFGESDSAQNCAECGAFLYGPEEYEPEEVG